MTPLMPLCWKGETPHPLLVYLQRNSCTATISGHWLHHTGGPVASSWHRIAARQEKEAHAQMSAVAQNAHCHTLSQLAVGSIVRVHDHQSNWWSRVGTIVEV